MRLYLLQHGDSVPESVDPGRPLSAQGRADIERLRDRLARGGVRVRAVWHSGKTRARQTAELLQPLLAPGGPIRETAGLAPNDPAPAVLGLVQGEAGDLLVVSHLPLVGRVVSQALTGEPDRELVTFRPGSVCGLVRDGNGAWRLDLFLTPELY
jgi:phosphohistidine phosphatase